MVKKKKAVEISVVIPCLNEEKTVGHCAQKALMTLKKHKIKGEVIVVDNGSIDSSAKIARSAGAKIVYQPKKGYGNAYLKGFRAARGKYLIIGDADDTYDFKEINHFLKPLRNGYDLVMGSRFKGKIAPGAMPWSHRYIGNPLLSGFLRFLFKTKISDAHCGMRGLTKQAYRKMKLRTTGMEFASEMVIKALKNNLQITEVAVNYYPRRGESKLRSLHDGWRHLRFMLLYSPTYLFLVPGFFFILLGFLAIFFVFAADRITLFNHRADLHTMILGVLLVIAGFQIANIGLFARTYALTSDLESKDPLIQYLWQHFNLEKGLLLSSTAFLTGLGINIYILISWIKAGLGGLEATKPALLALAMMVLGLQGIFSSFFLSVLGIKKGR